MNTGIRRVAYAITVLMLVLVGQLTYLQVVKAKSYANDPRNIRTRIRDYARPRGEILSADGVRLAYSQKTNDEFKYQRLYPTRSLFAHVVGYQSFIYGNTGVEDSFNSVLVGRDFGQQIKNFGDILINKQDTGTVVLTMRNDAQQIVKNALGDQKGSVVVLDPTTGAIVAMYSNPTYDPQPLAGHESKDVQAYYTLLNANPEKPALPRAFGEIYPPGSTFKLVTTSTALETGTATPETTYPVVREITPPNTTKSIKNFGGVACGGTLAESFKESCNTTFAQIGLDLADKFPPGMNQFGIESAPPLDIAGAAKSTGLEGLPFDQNQPYYAQAGIGQGFVATSPLQMALVAAAIANNGVVMEPHVVGEIRDSDGAVVRHIAPKAWKTATTPQAAQQVKDMMVSVVQSGTGTAARVPGIAVAGKTGTAQTDTGAPHAWFIAFAPADAPQYAVAVFVEHGGARGIEATGGKVAAPIAGQILRQLLGR